MTRTFTRRELLGRAGAVGAAGLGAAVLGPLPGRVDAQPLRQMLSEERSDPTLSPPAARAGERRLVLGTLYGGNDGLNTLVPYEDPTYISQRQAMRILPDAVLPIGHGLGLHPSLVGIRALFDAGHVALVQGVGYPEPNLSHFASMAIWMTADPLLDTASGWLGRWLDATGTDPMRALSIGPNVPPALAGEKQQAGALQDTTSSAGQLPPGDKAFQSIYREAQRVTSFDTAIENVIATSGTNMLELGIDAAHALARVGPLDTGRGNSGDMGTELSIVGQLIIAGFPTKAYQVQMGGYDTHAAELGTQAQLLAQLDAAVTQFFTGLGRHPSAAGTVLVLYTEFGRRVLANASGGTDHGAANLVMVIGRDVRGGLYGEMPSLSRLDPDGNLVHNVDFRSVYATVLEHVIGVDSKSFLGARFPLLPFI